MEVIYNFVQVNMQGMIQPYTLFSSIFSEDDSDEILLVDADNAFSKINRNFMLHSIRIICLIIATYVIKSYSLEVSLFLLGSEEITSAESTTQGDPTAVPIS